MDENSVLDSDLECFFPDIPSSSSEWMKNCAIIEEILFVSAVRNLSSFVWQTQKSFYHRTQLSAAGKK